MSMELTLKIWRQAGPTAKGELVTYQLKDISPDMSFLEMLDVLNEQLIAEGYRAATEAGASLSAFLSPFRDRIIEANRKAGIRDPFEAVEHDALMAMAAAAHRNVTGGAAGTEPSSDEPDGGGGGAGGHGRCILRGRVRPVRARD